MVRAKISRIESDSTNGNIFRLAIQEGKSSTENLETEQNCKD